LLPTPQDFRLQRELGSGSLGTNYKATAIGSGAFVSLKAVRKDRLRPGTLERRVVTNERHVLSRLDHPYVVRFYCSFQTTNYLLLATEYLPDHTLQTLISQRYPEGLPKDLARSLLSELATAIEYLHTGCDVLHGNVRPENVRIDAGGHARLAGFNYAQVRHLNSPCCAR